MKYRFLFAMGFKVYQGFLTPPSSRRTVNLYQMYIYKYGGKLFYPPPRPILALDNEMLNLAFQNEQKNKPYGRSIKRPLVVCKARLNAVTVSSWL